MSRFKYSIETYNDEGNQAPFIITVIPSYSIADDLAGKVPDDIELATMIAKVLQDAVKRDVATFTGWTLQKAKKRVKGYLSIQNIDNGKSFTTPLRLSKVDLQNMLFAFDHVHQSNEIISMHEMEWSYQIDPNSLLSGGKAPLIPPTWAPPAMFRNTWKNHEFRGQPVNCAAFAINYLKNYKKKHYTDRNMHIAVKEAFILQQNLGWSEDVCFEDFEMLVKKWPTFKIVLIDGSVITTKISFTGKDYVFKNSENILYLYHYQDFSKNVKHYAACSNPIFNMKHKGWCHFCLCAFSLPLGHSCDGYIKDPEKRGLYPCKECKIIGKHKCPLISCKTCSIKYPRNSKYHRCIVEAADRRDKKSWFYGDGHEETKKDDGSYPAILAYDLESVFERQHSVKSVIVEQKMNPDFVYDENPFDVVEYDYYYDKHTPNLVVAMNIFTKEEWSFFGEDCIKNFLKFLFTYNRGNCQVWAHNGSGYDTRLIFEQLPKMVVSTGSITQIMSGSRFMQLKVGSVVFRDSLRHLPGSLKKLGTDFCKDILMKGDFPFFFNRKENYDYIGAIPDLEYYPIGSFKDDASFSKFMEYHDSWKGRTDWNFKEQIFAYCRNDVLMLATILKKYHDICFAFSEQSPLGFVTGPGFVHSYCGNDSFRQITRDDPPPETEDKEAYRTWVESIAKTSYWCVLSPYEHYFSASALRGGRTENKAFLCSITDEEYEQGYRIGYTDVVSMYPSVQVEIDFPVGAPTIFVKDGAYYPCPKHYLQFRCECELEWKKSQFYRYSIVQDLVKDIHDLVKSKEFFGIVCCTLIPPKKLIHPYFMSKNEEMQKNIGTLRDEDHFQIIVTSLEILDMISYGYILKDIHCYHQYHRGNFWKEPTLNLYLEKMLNSGPAPESMTEKLAFIHPWVEKYGKDFGDKIMETWDRWGFNPAIRQVTKIMINSVWGKQAQRPVLPQTFLFNFKENRGDIEMYYRNCDSDARKHMQCVPIGQSHILNTCIDHQATPNLHNQYMPSACFVTAASRSKLYKEISKMGDRVLYMDTDSIIYKYRIGSSDYVPPEGSMLGEWETDGMIQKNGDITEFISFAPKTYGLKFKNGVKIVKAKGLCLNRATRNQFNYDIMKQTVLEFLEKGESKKLKVCQNGMAWNHKEGMKSIFTIKDISIQPEHFKGIVKNGYIYPFGFDFEK